ncbi:Syntaxin-52 [Raphanus sativus]|nr:Syntaxin-52 [Raphanus sativus]
MTRFLVSFLLFCLCFLWLVFLVIVVGDCAKRGLNLVRSFEQIEAESLKSDFTSVDLVRSTRIIGAGCTRSEVNGKFLVGSGGRFDRRSAKRVKMGSSSDAWMREYNEALKLSEDINGMMSERNSSGVTGPDAQRRASAIRRKITILGTRLDTLQSLLVGKQHVSEKEVNRRKDMVGNLRSKANQVASALNMSNFANRDSLLGPDTKPDDAMNRVSGMDNQGIVGFQRQVMREQDEGLEKLEETVMSTKHIALAVNEELTLQTRLIEDLDYHVDVTDSRLRRVQKSLAVMNKNMKGGCSCMSMLLSVLGIVGLALVIWLLVKYL